MRWNDHSRLSGQHAFLSASKHSWLNYDQDRLVEAFRASQAAALICGGPTPPNRPRPRLSPASDWRRRHAPAGSRGPSTGSPG